MKWTSTIILNTSLLLVFSHTILITAAVHAADIHDAVIAGDLDKVKSLIAANADLVNAPDQIKQTPLHLACRNLKPEIAHFLIDHGADINAINEYGVPVLNYAIKDGDVSYQIVKYLVDKGAKINIEKSANGTPLHMAAGTSNYKIAELLIEHGADLNAANEHGTPLQYNIIYWQEPNEDMAVFLVNNGAKIEEYSYGNNDLHLAAIKGYADLIQAMVDQGADIEAKNDYGHTPLYYATRHGRHRAANVLIAAGADKSAIAENNFGHAAQLRGTMQEGQAHLWYLGGVAPPTGFAVKSANNLLIFDPYKMDDAPETGLANGVTNPEELAGQKVTFFLTKKEVHPFNPTINELAARFPDATIISSFAPNEDKDEPDYHQLAANKSYPMNGMQVQTISTPPSTINSTGNLGYLVEVDGLRILHSGLLRSNGSAESTAHYRQQIDNLKSYGPIDIAILPFGYHHLGYIDYEQYLYLIDELAPQAVYLCGDDYRDEAHLKCLQVLEQRDVSVNYPDGGIAVGQRWDI